LVIPGYPTPSGTLGFAKNPFGVESSRREMILSDSSTDELTEGGQHKRKRRMKSRIRKKIRSKIQRKSR
jgi:hypothetical protein